MDLTDAHAGFVIAAYAVSFAGLAALVIFILLRDRKLRRQASAFERDRANVL